DVGNIRPDQQVSFRVDAYPNETFLGSVGQVRLNPQVVQNVVTYSTVIDVPNPDLKLKPGMTANVNIEIARRTNVLRVPNAALRFRPTKDIFDALKQPMPPELERGFGRRGQQNAQGGAPSGAAPSAVNVPGAAPQPPGTATPGQAQATVQNNQQRQQNAQAGQQRQQNRQARQQQPDQNAAGADRSGGGRGQGRGGFANMTPEERQKRMEERMANMSPEERAQFEQRMKERQAQGGGFGGGSGFGGRGGQGNLPGRGSGGAGVQRDASAVAAGGAPAGTGGQRANRPGKQGNQADGSKLTTANASTIDSLFGPL